jgi:hypothetical protein
VLELSLAHPEVIRPLACAFIANATRSLTCHDAALSYLPEQEWPRLVQSAIDAYTSNPQNESAESVLEEATLQCPRTLHTHLDAIFTNRIMARTYYGPWPWRESGQRHLAYLRQGAIGRAW